MLKRFFELRGEVAEFMEKKGHPVGEHKCKEWVQDLAFLVDITQHLNTLNTTLQGCNKVVTQNEDSIRAFKNCHCGRRSYITVTLGIFHV